jgi:hypothetical protein
MRFRPEFIDLLFGLALSFAAVLKEYNRNPAYWPHLPEFNAHIANFFSDLLAIMDRGCIFEIIFNYFQDLEDATSVELFYFKAVALKMWTQHPHFVALNVPKSPSYVNVREMAKKYWQRHFFVGLLLSQVEFALAPAARQEMRQLALDLLAETMHSLDNDSRWKTTQKKKIAQMFLPFVVMVVDKFEQLHQLSVDERRKLYACFMFILKNVSDSVLKDYWEKETEKRLFTFFVLLQKASEEFEYKGAEIVSRIRQYTLGNNPLLAVYSNGETFEMISSALPIHSGDVAASATGLGLEGAGVMKSVSSFSGTRKGINGDSHQSTPTSQDKKSKKRKATESAADSTLASLSTSQSEATKSGPRRPVAKVSGTALEAELRKEQHFCREVSFIILDTTVCFVKNFSKSLRRREIFEKVWSVFPSLLRRNQSQSFTAALLRVLHGLLPSYKVHLFAKSNSVCGEFVFEALRYCNSPIAEMRDSAATIYSQMFDLNLAEMKNVDRMRLQSTIAIIKIVGERSSSNASGSASPSISASAETTFGRLLNVLEVVKKHFKSKPAIADTVAQLDTKIRSIISDNQKMLMYQHDPEMMSDLIYGISRQLTDSPDERISWLQNLAQFQAELGNKEESAQAKMVCAALAHAYLKLLGRWETNMAPAWQFVSPAIDSEIELPDLKALVALKYEVCQSSIFTTDGFADLVKEGVQLMRQGGLYESCVAAYRMLLPIYMETENYKKQKEIYGDLLQLTSLLTDETTLKQRIFSNYYRIAFYGDKFGPDLDGKEFVYKEANTTRVTDITDRLKAQYSTAFGAENLVLLPNTSKVVRADLDPKKCYLQIAAVDIYLSKEELDKKPTLFKQHFGIRRFVMEQPFTKGGKAQGELDEQCLRRTIFTTDCGFPYLKKRMRIVQKEDQELSPIENATALFEKKVASLKTEMNASPPNLKTLQRELQGTLLVQVNAGPAAIISMFLSDQSATKWPSAQRDALADLVIEFERALGFAVRLNKGFMDATPDQLALHTELEKGYQRFKSVMGPLAIFTKRKDERAKVAVGKMADEDEKSTRRLAADDTIAQEKAERRRSFNPMAGASITAALAEQTKIEQAAAAAALPPPIAIPSAPAAVISGDAVNDVKKRRRLTAEKIGGTSAATPPPSRAAGGVSVRRQTAGSGVPPLIAIPESGEAPKIASPGHGSIKKSSSHEAVQSSTIRQPVQKTLSSGPTSSAISSSGKGSGSTASTPGGSTTTTPRGAIASSATNTPRGTSSATTTPRSTTPRESVTPAQDPILMATIPAAPGAPPPRAESPPRSGRRPSEPKAVATAVVSKEEPKPAKKTSEPKPHKEDESTSLQPALPPAPSSAKLPTSGSLSSAAASSITEENTSKLANAAASAAVIIEEILHDLDAVPDRLSIAYEVAELAPLAKAVKAIKEELRKCSFAITVIDLPAPTGIDPSDRMTLIKTIITNEIEVTKEYINEIKSIVHYIDTPENMVTVLRVLKQIKLTLK